MWQSCVEIEGYSVACFDRFIEHEYLINLLDIHTSMKRAMSPALNGSSAILSIRRFEGSDAIEIRNGITFDFYTGLLHTV